MMSKLLTVVGDGLTARIDADRGAKIVSLEDSRGHEWLAQPPPPSDYAGRSFVESEMCGWDECAPTITACTLEDGVELPDHGDLWDVAWTAIGDSLSARGRSLDYTLSRTIRSAPGGLRFEYTATAGESRIPFLWAAHPQFPAPPGSTVEVTARRLVDVLSQDRREDAATPDVLTIDSVVPGGCRKLYVSPSEPIDSAALTIPGRGRLQLRWSAEIAPYVGIWFDNGRYSRAPVIAIEPSTGYFDSLAVAIAEQRVLTLDAHRSVSWFVEVVTA